MNDEEYIASVNFDGMDHTIEIEPVYDHVLHERYYILTCDNLPSFIMFCNKDEGQNFMIQGDAPNLALEMENDLAHLLKEISNC